MLTISLTIYLTLIENCHFLASIFICTILVWFTQLCRLKSILSAWMEHVYKRLMRAIIVNHSRLLGCFVSISFSLWLYGSYISTHIWSNGLFQVHWLIECISKLYCCVVFLILISHSLIATVQTIWKL